MNTKVRSLMLSVVATAALLGVCHYRAHHGPVPGTFGPAPMRCMDGQIQTTSETSQGCHSRGAVLSYLAVCRGHNWVTIIPDDGRAAPPTENEVSPAVTYGATHIEKQPASEVTWVQHDDPVGMSREAGMDVDNYEIITNIGHGADGWHVGVMRNFKPIMPDADLTRRITAMMRGRGAKQPVHVDPGFMGKPLISKRTFEY